MSEIKKPFNEYQTAKYNMCYSTDTRKKVKASHYVVTYNGRTLTNPKSYGECVNDRKVFFQMGIEFPDKTKFEIKPYKG